MCSFSPLAFAGRYLPSTTVTSHLGQNDPVFRKCNKKVFLQRPPQTHTNLFVCLDTWGLSLGADASAPLSISYKFQLIFDRGRCLWAPECCSAAKPLLPWEHLSACFMHIILSHGTGSSWFLSLPGRVTPLTPPNTTFTGFTNLLIRLILVGFHVISPLWWYKIECKYWIMISWACI